MGGLEVEDGGGAVRWMNGWLEVEDGSSGGVGKSPCQWIDGRGRWR